MKPADILIYYSFTVLAVVVFGQFYLCFYYLYMGLPFFSGTMLLSALISGNLLTKPLARFATYNERTEHV